MAFFAWLIFVLLCIAHESSASTSTPKTFPPRHYNALDVTSARRQLPAGCLLNLKGGKSTISFSLTTFDPKGTLGQIENANVAVASGSLCVGVKFQGGVVLASPNQLRSVLVEKSGTPKIAEISDHVAMIYAGIGADSRVLFAAGLRRSLAWRETYGCAAGAAEVAAALGELAQAYGMRGGVRPFGAGVLLAGAGPGDDPALYRVDPSGRVARWRANALGRGAPEALRLLESEYEENLSEERAILLAVDVIEKTQPSLSQKQDEDVPEVIEVAVIKPSGIVRHEIPVVNTSGDDDEEEHHIDKQGGSFAA